MAIAKGAFEHFARMFNREHGTDIRMVRTENVYGGHQQHLPVRKIFPQFVRLVIEATGCAPEIEHLPMRPCEPAGAAVMGRIPRPCPPSALCLPRLE